MPYFMNLLQTYKDIETDELEAEDYEDVPAEEEKQDFELIKNFTDFTGLVVLAISYVDFAMFILYYD